MEAAILNSADHSNVVSISVFVALICLCIVIGHLLQENRWVNESITAIVIGCISGTIILFMSKGTSSHILRFDENLFFIYLLPPIIFNAGFQVKKKHFFRNFGTIMLFGVIGVFISTAIISAGSRWLFPKVGFVGLDAWDYLAIGTIFSSTDTVCTLQVLHQDQTPLLYSLVFGEGVVNDATSVVLFNAIQKIDISRINGWVVSKVVGDFLYLFSTSTILGITAGLLTAYVLKTLYFGRHSTDREIALMSLMAYLSYMLAEVKVLYQ
ncbi:Sodium/hydrogen exchanger 4 [Ranunculus cassubicifolius]